MNEAGARLKIAQVTAELAEDGEPIDSCVRTQVGHTFIPTCHHITADRLAGFEFAYQKAIQVEEDFLIVDPDSTSWVARIAKCLEPRGKRAAEKTGGHTAQSFEGHGIATCRSELRSALA